MSLTQHSYPSVMHWSLAHDSSLFVSDSQDTWLLAICLSLELVHRVVWSPARPASTSLLLAHSLALAPACCGWIANHAVKSPSFSHVPSTHTPHTAITLPVHKLELQLPLCLRARLRASAAHAPQRCRRFRHGPQAGAYARLVVISDVDDLLGQFLDVLLNLGELRLVLLLPLHLSDGVERAERQARS